jgi:hypothetical protein
VPEPSATLGVTQSASPLCAAITMKHDPKFATYTQPAGGWGSVQSLARSLTREHVPFSGGLEVISYPNKSLLIFLANPTFTLALYPGHAFQYRLHRV